MCKLCQRRVYLRSYYRRKQAEQAEHVNGNGNGNGDGNGNGHRRSLTYQDLNDAEFRARLKARIDEAMRARMELS